MYGWDNSCTYTYENITMTLHMLHKYHNDTTHAAQINKYQLALQKATTVLVTLKVIQNSKTRMSHNFMTFICEKICR